MFSESDRERSNLSLRPRNTENIKTIRYGIRLRDFREATKCLPDDAIIKLCNTPGNHKATYVNADTSRNIINIG